MHNRFRFQWISVWISVFIFQQFKISTTSSTSSKRLIPIKQNHLFVHSQIQIQKRLRNSEQIKHFNSNKKLSTQQIIQQSKLLITTIYIKTNLPRTTTTEYRKKNIKKLLKYLNLITSQVAFQLNCQVTFTQKYKQQPREKNNIIFIVYLLFWLFIFKWKMLF